LALQTAWKPSGSGGDARGEEDSQFLRRGSWYGDEDDPPNHGFSQANYCFWKINSGAAW